MRHRLAILAAVAPLSLPALRARAELILTPPDLVEAVDLGASRPPLADRLELGLGIGELAGDFVLRSAFLGLSLAVLCIGSCGSSSPWLGLASLLVTPLIDAVLVWGVGMSSNLYQPRLLWTLLASYGGAVVEGALLLLGLLTGDWGLTIALGLAGSALAAAGTVYVQLVTKTPLEAAPEPAPSAARAGLVTLATF